MEQKQLVISPENAKKIYTKPEDGLRAILEDTFGKPFFSEKITDRVKTFDHACEVLGIDPNCVWLHGEDNDEVAYKKLKVIVRALNEGWEPDYNNGSQRKWYPWFYMDSPGFRLNVCLYAVACTGVGARLVFKTEELARYAANQFSSLYSDYYQL